MSGRSTTGTDTKRVYTAVRYPVLQFKAQQTPVQSSLDNIFFGKWVIII